MPRDSVYFLQIFIIFHIFSTNVLANIEENDIPDTVKKSYGGLTKEMKIELFGANGQQYHKIYITPKNLVNIRNNPASVIELAVCERRLSALVDNQTKFYDYFMCPQDELDQRYCCGEEKEQTCCYFTKFLGNFAPVRSDGFVPVASVILMGVIFFGSLNIGAIVFLNKRRLHKRKLAKENTIVVYSGLDNGSEMRGGGSSLISARPPPSKAGSVMGRNSGNSVTAKWVKSATDYTSDHARNNPLASPGASVILDGNNSVVSGSARYSNLPPSASRDFEASSGILSSRASTTGTARPGNWSVDTANNVRKSRSRENISLSRSREKLDSQSAYAPSLPAPSISGLSQNTGGGYSITSAPPRAEYFSMGVKPMGPKKSRRAEESIGEVPEGTLSRWRKSQNDLDVFDDEPQPPQEKLISARPAGVGNTPVYAQKPIALSSMRADGKKPKKERYIEAVPEPEPELNPAPLFTPNVELISGSNRSALGGGVAPASSTISGVLGSDASYPLHSELDPRAPSHAPGRPQAVNTPQFDSGSRPIPPSSGLVSAGKHPTTAGGTAAKIKGRQYRPPKIIGAKRGRSSSSSSQSDVEV